jgi:divalent metal cation (Fe/Co/Zn/Cd) transporter
MATAPIAPPETLRAVHRIQAITIAWMILEAILSLYSAWSAHSPALAAFGGDSAVELVSALVVLWRFRNPAAESAERIAARLTATLLFVVAAFVAVVSVRALLGYTEPRPSYLGIAVLAAAALIMPWLAKEKRRLSAQTQSAALRADAAESTLCAYLSLIALAGLAAHALFKIEWADPIAALAILPLILYEARESLRGHPCDCCP